jgi:hypothetical protein
MASSLANSLKRELDRGDKANKDRVAYLLNEIQKKEPETFWYALELVKIPIGETWWKPIQDSYGKWTVLKNGRR